MLACLSSHYNIKSITSVTVDGSGMPSTQIIYHFTVHNFTCTVQIIIYSSNWSLLKCDLFLFAKIQRQRSVVKALDLGSEGSLGNFSISYENNIEFRWSSTTEQWLERLIW